MEEKPKIGDVYQINPNVAEKDSFFAGCFLQVTEVKDWGVQGFVCIPGKRGEMPGMAFTRQTWDTIVKIGTAHWVGAKVNPTELEPH